MRNSTVEIILTEDEIVESRLATLDQRIPDEVCALGPAALAAYRDFLQRVAGAPNTVEHIELSTAAAA